MRGAEISSVALRKQTMKNYIALSGSGLDYKLTEVKL